MIKNVIFKSCKEENRSVSGKQAIDWKQSFLLIISN